MAIELLAENIGKSGLRDKGNVIRKTVTSTSDGSAVVLYSAYPMLVTSWQISNGGEAINYRVLTSKEHQPKADDDSWDELVASTALAANASDGDTDNEAHYTAIMVVVDSATPSTVRVRLLGSV